MSDEKKGWLAHRVVRWQEPTAALDDMGPYRLQMFDSELGLWLTLATVDLEEEAMAQGIPVLRGPYVVDFTDFPDSLDKKTLWVPAIGDVLLRLFPDWQTVVQWDGGVLGIGQNVDISGAPTNTIAYATDGHISRDFSSALDTDIDSSGGTQGDSLGVTLYASAVVFQSTDPVQIQWKLTDGAATAGHVELYALVARALAPE